jgi:hypothetical protein
MSWGPWGPRGYTVFDIHSCSTGKQLLIILADKSGISKIWKKSKILKISGFWYFFNSAKFHFLIPLQAMQSAIIFPAKVVSHRSAQQQTKQKKLKHFVCQDSDTFLDLQNFTCKYLYRLWEVPPFLLPRHSHIDSHSFGPIKSRHFACYFM